MVIILVLQSAVWNCVWEATASLAAEALGAGGCALSDVAPVAVDGFGVPFIKAQFDSALAAWPQRALRRGRAA